jgi:hypothetical protein
LLFNILAHSEDIGTRQNQARLMRFQHIILGAAAIAPWAIAGGCVLCADAVPDRLIRATGPRLLQFQPLGAIHVQIQLYGLSPAIFMTR